MRTIPTTQDTLLLRLNQHSKTEKEKEKEKGRVSKALRVRGGSEKKGFFSSRLERARAPPFGPGRACETETCKRPWTRMAAAPSSLETGEGGGGARRPRQVRGFRAERPPLSLSCLSLSLCLSRPRARPAALRRRAGGAAHKIIEDGT
jgi:hypothetical protein